MKKKYLFLHLMILFGLFACTRTGSNKQAKRSTENFDKEIIAQEKTDPIAEREKYLISYNQVGPFVIGSDLPGPTTMMKYQIRIEEKARQIEGEVVNETFTIIAENGSDLLWIKPAIIADKTSIDNTIKEIIVISPKYKTLENIGIGSTLFDFQKAYPENRLWYTYVSDMYVLETDQVKAQFILDKGDYIGDTIEITSDQITLHSDDFNTEARIRRIRMFSYSHKL